MPHCTRPDHRLKLDRALLAHDDPGNAYLQAPRCRQFVKLLAHVVEAGQPVEGSRNVDCCAGPCDQLRFRPGGGSMECGGASVGCGERAGAGLAPRHTRARRAPYGGHACTFAGQRSGGGLGHLTSTRTRRASIECPQGCPLVPGPVTRQRAEPQGQRTGQRLDHERTHSSLERQRGSCGQLCNTEFVRERAKVSPAQ